jgi:hypothetical protein
MMPFKDRVGQIVIVRPAAVALIALATRMSMVVTVADNIVASAFWIFQPVRPANLTNLGVAFLLVNQVMQRNQRRLEFD